MLKKEKFVQEIERKFLVGILPKNLRSYPSKKLVAGYFKNKKGQNVRIRKEGKRYFKVKKIGNGLVRDIGSGDKEITKKDFKTLWPKTKGQRLSKVRYYIRHRKFIIELDKYDDFKNFYTVEVEFKTVTEARKFVPPRWFGQEVTEDRRYANRSLAVNGIPKMKS